MPVSIRTLPTTTGTSYYPSSYTSSRYSSVPNSTSTYSSNRFRPSASSNYSSTSTSTYNYRKSGGDDTASGSSSTTAATSNRFGVSSSTRFTTKSSVLDRDIIGSNKPPTGQSSSSSLSRYRSSSDNRARDLSLDNHQKGSYISSISGVHYRSSSPSSSSATTKLSDSSYQNTKRQSSSSSSLARSVATSGADLYEKYSPSNYIPKVELSRSRSLSETTGIKLLDTTNNHHTTTNNHSNNSIGLGSRASSRDRETSIDSTAAITNKVRNASLRSPIPPKSVSPSRYWDRDGRSSLASRTLSDSAANDATGGAATTSYNHRSSIASTSSSYLDKSSLDDSDGLCGLRNIGNTCFMNSVIQCLSHTKELTKYLKTTTDSRSTTKDQRILYEFSKLIRDMWQPKTRSVTPSELKSAFSSKHRMYSGCAQQDAQEFLRFFLDSLHNATNTGVKGEKLELDENLSDNRIADMTWEWYTKVENSVIQNLFVGQLKSTLKCTVCGNTSVTFDPFWDLSVPLQSSSKCKLESCLDFFIKEEVMDGDEMPTCSKCKTRRKCTKSFTIQRFPKYLVIHLKRFSETRWSKLTNIVEFPTGELGLDMASYSANTVSAKYSLYGISNHMGSTAGGHYVALCKHPVTKKWHEFNDNIVSDASESGLVSSSAYLLFYERA